jgi:hypothetical protein
MTISYRIINANHDPRIECRRQIYGLEDLCEAIWLINMELRGAYLSKRERTEAHHQVTQYQAMLDALRSAGA